MANSWLNWAQRLQALASTGAHFSSDDFDLERYQEVGGIANAMLAELADTPVERIESFQPDFGKGYSTPQIDVRGAVLREDQILLVQEKADALWTLPGGYADVGLSAAENCVKEVQEEAGLEVSASGLYAVRHKAKHGYKPDVRDFYKFFFLCQEETERAPRPGIETLDAAFFHFDALPPLSTARVIIEDLELARRFALNPETGVWFD